MTDAAFLAIDVGTTVLKAVILTADGEELHVARRPVPLAPVPDGRSEVDMDRLWADVAAAVTEAVAGSLAGDRVRAVAVGGIACGAWLVDDAARPLGNAVLWNDGRAVGVIERWRRDGVFDRIFALSGNAVFPGYTLPLLRWFDEHDRARLLAARTVLCCKDWLRSRITGDLHTDESDASYLPWDIDRRRHSDELLALCELEAYRSLLPIAVPSDRIVGDVPRSLAASWGIPAGTPVVAGLVDTVAATIGAGAIATGQACSIVGTSCVNSVVLDAPDRAPEGVGITAAMPEGRWLRSLVNTAGTMNLDWLAALLAGPADEPRAIAALEVLAAAAPIGAGGVLFHPYLNTTGVYSPFVSPSARAQFSGVAAWHRQAHLARAVYEGLALSMVDCYDHVALPTSVRITGGGSRSAFWCQLFADCLTVEVQVPSGDEVGARGLAIVAGIGTGLFRDLDDGVTRMVKVAKRFAPTPGAAERYRELLSVYRDVYRVMSSVWPRLLEVARWG